MKATLTPEGTRAAIPFEIEPATVAALQAGEAGALVAVPRSLSVRLEDYAALAGVTVDQLAQSILRSELDLADADPDLFEHHRDTAADDARDGVSI